MTVGAPTVSIAGRGEVKQVGWRGVVWGTDRCCTGVRRGGGTKEGNQWGEEVWVK